MTAAPLRARNGLAALPGWDQLEPVVPGIVATMRRYLEQISCVLRPGSVAGVDIPLRSFAGFLAEAAPEVTSTAQVTRPGRRWSGPVTDGSSWSRSGSLR